MTDKTPAKSDKIDPKDLRFAILATDTVLWTIIDNVLHVRLIKVSTPYFQGLAGLPGGLLAPTETAEQSAKRHVENKAKIDPEKVYLEQLYTFSEVNRDPRGRVVAVAYAGFVPWENLSTQERENGGEVWWSPVNKLPKLAYDHKHIIQVALNRLKARITYTTLIAKFMPAEFTLTELETAYESILEKEIDKRNFRKKILALGLLKKLNKERRGQKFRPAKLHTFISTEVRTIEVL
jgi:8-oxo-dGTP diphosphatase